MSEVIYQLIIFGMVIAAGVYIARAQSQSTKTIDPEHMVKLAVYDLDRERQAWQREREILLNIIASQTGAQSLPATKSNPLSALVEFISQRFSPDEREVLAFEAGVDTSLWSRGRDHSLDLVQQADREGKLGDLLNAVKRKRPDVDYLTLRYLNGFG